MTAPDYRPISLAASFAFYGVSDWRGKYRSTRRRGAILNSLTLSALLTLLDYRERRGDDYWWVPLQRIAAKHQLSPKALNHRRAIQPLIDVGFLSRKPRNAYPVGGSYWLTREGHNARQQMRRMIKASQK